MAGNEKAINRKMDRRHLFKLAGAGAAGAALAGVHGGPLDPRQSRSVVLAQEEEETFEWDEEYDVVVVGSGAAAGAAATTADEQGASVVVLEKSDVYGGTSGKSGGVYWIPNNSQMQEAGYEDPKEDALRYMARVSFPHIYDPEHETLGLPQHNYDLIEAFYDNAGDAIDYLDEIDALHSAMVDEFPDYYTELPQNAAPYGREMGPETEDGGVGAGAEMIRQLRAAVDEREIPIRMEHRVERLVQNEEGRVIGVQASNADGETVSIGASQGVIFGSGGFTHNPEMRLNFLRGPILGGCAVNSNEGDFVHIAGAAGAALGNMQHAWWAEIVLEQALEVGSVPDDIWQPPGDSILYVNRFGHRVVNEKIQYNERTQVHFNWDPVRAEYTNLLLFMVYDQRTAEEFAGAYPLPAEPTGADYVISGETLEELSQNVQDRLSQIAADTGGVELDEDFLSNLQGTLGQFNRFAEEGVDRQFHRGEHAIEEYFHITMGGDGPTEHEYPNPRMYPLSDEGPYYCIIVAGGSLDTKGGPVINTSAQVLNNFGEVIPGLYGAGNCIASPAGQAYWAAGGTLGPALTFGHIAAMSATEGVEGDDDESADDDSGEDDESEQDDSADENGQDDADEDTGDDADAGEDEDDTDEDSSDSGEATTHVVETGDNYFEPEHITIKAGDSITWQNVGALVHTATGDPDKLIDPANGELPEGAEPWDSGNFGPGEEYTHTFDVAGEYTYACIPHEAAGMIGSITVEE